MLKPAILLGDEAVAMGAVHSGLSGVYGYPGTPSTEIFESVQKFGKATGVHAVWSTNEKVGYEEALGMSFAGKRSLVTMKHVGLNVAADPFMNSAITGVNGGLVLAVADDPGMHSSQNEQDSRWFGHFAMIPMLEPGNQQEAYEMTRLAFELSEELNVPVMLRLVTRLAHSRADIQILDSNPNQKTLNPSRDWRKWTLLPMNARANYSRLIQSQASFLKKSEESPFNQLRLSKTKKGIIISGIAANYLLENFPENQSDYSVLIIKQYPIPVQKVQSLIEHSDEILVIEEGSPFIEQHLRGLVGIGGKQIRGKLSGEIPRTGELTPEIVRTAVGLAPHPALKSAAQLASRPPQLCSGCPHGTVFNTLKEALRGFPEAHVFSDIGCYTLGALPPYNAIETCVDMGASISMSIGAAHAGVHPAISVIGDSTFTHSGMTPLLDAVRENTPVTIFVLDNSTTAMTGGQPIFATGPKMLRLIRGLGVSEDHIIQIQPLPNKQSQNVKSIQQELAYKGLSVIVAQRECLEEIKRKKKKKRAEN